MKVLFLDVDGVMNNIDLLMADGIHAIGESMLDLVKKIVDSTGAMIVVSSTWRIYPDAFEILKSRLLTRGLTVLDRTPEIMPKKMSWHVQRHEEISAWLSLNQQVTKFAIVDDDGDAEIPGNFFQTDFADGLTEEIANKIIDHLNE